MEAIHVVVADESPVVISGFRRFCETHPRISVIAEAQSLSQLVAVLQRSHATVTLVDWGLVAALPNEARKTIEGITRRTTVICSGMPESLSQRCHALRFGARGFISRHYSARNVVNAILRVASGNIYLGNVSAEAFLQFELSYGSGTEEANRLKNLTSREHQVIHMVGQGFRNRKIAEEMHISESTVCHHLTSIYAKVGVQDRAGLLIYAYRNGLETITPSDREPALPAAKRKVKSPASEAKPPRLSKTMLSRVPASVTDQRQVAERDG
jgi:DNA-binding NarL/FixJ family response regulator